MKKTLIIAAAALAMLATPSLAQKSQTSGQGMQSQHMPRLFVGPGVVQGNDVYDCTGKYLGADPDPNIRSQMLRQGDPECKSR